MKEKTKIGKDDRYELLSKLGVGGMGVVYRARDKELGREVAVKVIRNKDCGCDASRRFKREARMLASLSHPNLLRIFEVELDKEEPFIVTELLTGDDLYRLWKKGKRLSIKQGRQLAKQIASALAALHEVQIIHRDIKIANIFKEKNGNFKLMDLGLARPTEETRMTDMGAVVGTLAYMPPEVIQGYDAIPASDIYQFGLALHEAMTGDGLQGAVDGNPLSTRMIDVDSWCARKASATLPEAFRQLIDNCCEKDITIRPQNGTELLSLVDELLFAPKEKRTTRKSREHEVDTAAMKPVAKTKPKSPSLFVWLLPLALVLSLVYYAAKNISPTKRPMPNDLFSKAREYLLLPDELILVLPPRGKVPRWQLELDEGPVLKGTFTKERQGFTATIPHPPQATSGQLLVHQGHRLFGYQRFTYPKEVFKKMPTAKYGFDRVEVQWAFHGRANGKVQLRATKRRLVLDEQSSTKGQVSLLTKNLHRSERNVDWTLRYGNREFASGEGQIGVSQRGEIPFRSPRGRDHRGFPLFPPIVQGSYFYTFHDPALFVCWEGQRGARGLQLVPKWYAAIAKSSVVGIELGFSFLALLGQDKLIVGTRSEKRYLLNLQQMEESWQQRRVGFTPSDENDHYDYLQGRPARLKTLSAQAVAVGSGMTVSLSDNSLLAAVQAASGKIALEHYLTESGELQLSHLINGSQIYAFKTITDELIGLIHRQSDSCLFTCLKYEEKKLVVAFSKELGAAPDVSRGIPIDGPHLASIASLPELSKAVLAYDSFLFSFSYAKGQFNFKKIELPLPAKSFTRAAVPLTKKTVLLLNLSPFSQHLNVQSRMNLFVLEMRDKGCLLKKVIERFVSERALICRTSISLTRRGRFHIYGGSDYFVLSQTKGAKVLYKGLLREFVFRYPLFAFDEGIFALTRDGAVVGMDVIAY